MSKLEIQFHKQDMSCIITLTGDAGIVEAEELETQLTEIPKDKPDQVIFDLSKLNLISSLAITSLINFRKQVQRGCRIAIVVDAGHVKDSLVRSRVIELFDHYETLDDALAD